MRKIMVVIAVWAMVTLACGGSATPVIVATSGGPTLAAAATNPPPKVGKVGDRVEQGGYALTVNKVDSATAISIFKPTKAGYIFLTVDVVIENIGTDEVAYNPLYFKVKDSDDFEYNKAVTAPEPTLKSGRLARGEKVRGWIAFEMPPGAKGLVMSYSPLVLGSGVGIRVDLGK